MAAEAASCRVPKHAGCSGPVMIRGRVNVMVHDVTVNDNVHVILYITYYVRLILNIIYQI